ncbi:1,4-dihydroxy-2-naphthoate octaprenyltransferase [Kluyvera cryocrescens]|uniref:1,4-dihydroxy-2-naphthoate octaprenyltransferase n=1 Tax=Kluyvera cryocrescens TaxID=580 RepID=A0A485B2U4_KLUCR|nr:1,4-dihydroxy-2-naphthoate octaprenyltransferase [Kluyvera cryocrescens]
MTNTPVSRTQAWLESLRPKTLPLACAAIIVGTALAWWQGHFDPIVAVLSLITASLLQILSNLANDYGDAVKGSDKPDRIGPLRGMQKGVITQEQMKRALIVTVALICLFGLALLFTAYQTLGDFIGFPGAGTAGDRCRHYLHRRYASLRLYWPRRRFGTDFLRLAKRHWQLVFTGTQSEQARLSCPQPPAACWPQPVLNINNLRDIDSDRENGKNTLARSPGPLNARRYHVCLLMGTLVCLALFNLISLHSPWGWAVRVERPAAGETGALRHARALAAGDAADAGTNGKRRVIN